MREIRTSGSMSGDEKRSVAAWPKLPRSSSTLPLGQGSVDVQHERINVGAAPAQRSRIAQQAARARCGSAM